MSGPSRGHRACRRQSEDGCTHPRHRRTFSRQATVLTLAIMVTASLFTIIVYSIFKPILPLPLYAPILAVVAAMLVCVIAGSILSVILSRRLFRPLEELTRATQKIAAGDFKVQIEEFSDGDSDMETLLHSFNNMARELDSTEMFRNDFINNFSHEFKTPIVSIRGFARLLQENDLSEEQKRKYVDIIATESDRLANMATNILLLSKLENQQIVSDKTQFYLDEQLRRAILMLEKQWSSKNIGLEISLDEIVYEFNEDILLQVWVNLLGNAFKFTPPRGEVACTLRREGDEAVVMIRDTGCGMSEDVQKRIFEKFYQGDASHSGAGNGIGLNIVKRILFLCGGSIRVESSPGMGSTFTVRLPLAETEHSPT